MSITKNDLESLGIVIGIPIVLMAALVIGIVLIGNHYFKNDERDQTNQKEIEELTQIIKSGKLDCKFIADMRFKYSGDSFINAMDDSWVKSKMMAYYNANNCGPEWNWWES